MRVKDLEKLSLLDPLTQLAVRNFIENEMKNILEEKRRLNVSFGILFMDIDHVQNIQHDNQPLSVTISVGATLVEANDTMESIIKRVDTLLYKSKKNGRNCLTVG